jgi:hypothetical protein
MVVMRNFAKFIFLVFLAVSFLSSGCQSENYGAIGSEAISRARAGIADKSQAAQLLQSIIRDSYLISINHRGFKPKATPPVYPPDWSPKEVLVVDESRMGTWYEVQHWKDERGETKASQPDAVGIATTFYRWQGTPDGRTIHEVRIPFDSVKRVSVEQPFLYKCSIISIYYLPTLDDGTVSDDYKSFKIWLLNSWQRSSDKKNCLAALSLLCSNLQP